MTLTLAIARSGDPRAQSDALAELCAELRGALGAAVDPMIFDRYDDLAQAVIAAKASIAWMPPLLALQLEEKRVAKPIAIPIRNGDTSYRAALFARTGSIPDLRSLQSKRIAWVDRTSAAGYAVPRMMLSRKGHDPARFFAEESFYESHDRVVAAVLGELADAGATYCRTDSEGKITWAAWMESDGPGTLHLESVAVSEPIPNDGFVVDANLDPALAEMLVAALVSEDGPGKVARALFRAERFVAAKDAHYAPLRALLRRAHTDDEWRAQRG